MKLQLIFIMVLLAFCIPCFAQTQNTDTYLVVSYHQPTYGTPYWWKCHVTLENSKNRVFITSDFGCSGVKLGNESWVGSDFAWVKGVQQNTWCVPKHGIVDGWNGCEDTWNVVKAERKHK